ncbi:MAG TPA: hypothetical protein ENI08_00530 [Candidatus Dependentiae bacterium]|nr:hypothetical protein [Candidatus Dependentiae bacterium]
MKQYVLLFFLISCSGFIALLFCTKQYIWILPSLLCLLPFLGGKFLVQHADDIPSYLSKIGYVRPPKSEAYPLDVAQEIQGAITDLLQQRSDVNCIVMPESSYPFPLNEDQDMIDLWCDNALPDDVSLLIGAHRREQHALHNCVYLLNQGRIVNFYDKRHMMPFVEKVPSLWNIFTCFYTLFLQKNREFSPGNRPNVLFTLSNNVTFVPRICSELFFDTTGNRDHIIQKDIPMLLVVNDSWFLGEYMRNLICLYAKLKAIEEGREILYVGHYHALWINRTGNSIFL